MIVIGDLKTKTGSDGVEKITQKIEGINFEELDYLIKEAQARMNFLDKYKKNYEPILDANDDFLSIVNSYLGDPGDENIMLLMDKINTLSPVQFLEYVDIKEDNFKKQMSLEIDVSRLSDDMFKKVCEDFMKNKS